MVGLVALLAGCLGRPTRGDDDEDDLAETCRYISTDCTDVRTGENADPALCQQCVELIDTLNREMCERNADVASEYIVCPGDSLTVEQVASRCAALCGGVEIHPCDPARGMSDPDGCTGATDLEDSCLLLIDACQ